MVDRAEATQQDKSIFSNVVVIPEQGIDVGDRAAVDAAIKRSTRPTVEERREEAGFQVANLFFKIFGYILFCLLLVVGASVIVSTNANRDALSEKAVDVYKTTLATFSSLAAFVLGYYFGQNKTAKSN